MELPEFFQEAFFERGFLKNSLKKIKTGTFQGNAQEIVKKISRKLPKNCSRERFQGTYQDIYIFLEM